jgi:predicted RNase H-like HicB family nuclease
MNNRALAYHVILENAGGGIWTAEIPAFRAVTEGRGEAGARVMAANLIAGYIRIAKRDGVSIPKPDAVIPRAATKVRRIPKKAAHRRKPA